MSNFTGLEVGNLWQIAVPEECWNKGYDKLFQFLLKKDLIALGLYRLPLASDNKYSYVACNPESRTNITFRDRVFVLGRDIAKELIIDYHLKNATGKSSKDESKKKG